MQLMQLILFVGLQASGKSTFCRERFFDTHVRLNLDMLRTRHREKLLFEACLEAKQPVVIDNTNPTPEDRARYIAAARAKCFSVVGYYFRSSYEECCWRNAQRPTEQQLPEVALKATRAKLVLPAWEEGFDELYYVGMKQGQGFFVDVWPRFDKEEEPNAL